MAKDEQRSGLWLGLAILAVGIAIGRLARPERWFDPPAPGSRAAARPAGELHPTLRPRAEPAAAPDNGLSTLRIKIPPASAQVLQAVRDRALDRGVILQAAEDTVPAEVALDDGAFVPAEIRIKGDWTDHVETDREQFEDDMGAFGITNEESQPTLARSFLKPDP